MLFRGGMVVALMMATGSVWGQQAPTADGTGSAPASALSDTDLSIRATYRFTDYPERACPAAAEYARRGVSNSKSVAIAETILPYCRKVGLPALPSASGSPQVGRYSCLRLGGMSNQVADDLTIRPGQRYAVAGAVGTFDVRGGTLTFASGPWASARSNWIGIVVPAGATAKYPTIVVRDRRDVAAGNRRDLQWCNLAN